MAEHKVDDARLLACLLPFVKSGGKSFIKYDENEVVGKAKTDGKQIKAAHDVLAALKTLWPNTSITMFKVQNKRVLRKLVQKSWALDAEAAEDWACTMDLRIRNMISAIKTAVRQPVDRRPPWVQDLPWNTAVAAAPPNWIVEFDFELNLAVRRKKPDDAPEPCKPFVHAGIVDPVIATWPDGWKSRVEGVTVEYLRGVLGGKKKRG